MLIKPFERLVLAHQRTSNAPLLDSLQFAYWADMSVDVNIGLYYVPLLTRDICTNRDCALLLSPNTVKYPLLWGQCSCQFITSFLLDTKQQARKKGWEKSLPASRQSALATPRDVCLLPCSSDSSDTNDNGEPRTPNGKFHNSHQGQPTLYLALIHAQGQQMETSHECTSITPREHNLLQLLPF